MAESIETLKRNDVEGALAVFTAEYKRTKGKPSPDLCHSLLMLQDDPADYLDAIASIGVGDDS